MAALGNDVIYQGPEVKAASGDGLKTHPALPANLLEPGGDTGHRPVAIMAMMVGAVMLSRPVNDRKPDQAIPGAARDEAIGTAGRA